MAFCHNSFQGRDWIDRNKDPTSKDDAFHMDSPHALLWQHLSGRGLSWFPGKYLALPSLKYWKLFDENESHSKWLEEDFSIIYLAMYFITTWICIGLGYFFSVVASHSEVLLPKWQWSSLRLWKQRLIGYTLQAGALWNNAERKKISMLAFSWWNDTDNETGMTNLIK